MNNVETPRAVKKYARHERVILGGLLELVSIFDNQTKTHEYQHDTGFLNVEAIESKKEDGVAFRLIAAKDSKGVFFDITEFNDGGRYIYAIVNPDKIYSYNIKSRGYN